MVNVYFKPKSLKQARRPNSSCIERNHMAGQWGDYYQNLKQVYILFADSNYIRQ